MVPFIMWLSFVIITEFLHTNSVFILSAQLIDDLARYKIKKTMFPHNLADIAAWFSGSQCCWRAVCYQSDAC